jgi:HD superfamily phosphohydrolase
LTRLEKKKIINDPVYGFITIPGGLVYQIISHPYFQRLRRIKQMGLNDFVYPGALHTRFHHALGAMHLMSLALRNLRHKGQDISTTEYESMLIAILLHDIGHGPFSHALESTLLSQGNHEEVSVIIMQHLNRMFDGALEMALEIFQNQYSKGFFHQLVSSQLDIDRLDYLKRDSFFTGVSEGAIGSDRIINMLNVHQDQLVVEEKGIYSIENFLNARRLMYWQVYLHKTSVAAEKMMVALIERAQFLVRTGVKVPCTRELHLFLANPIETNDLISDPDLLDAYCLIDDYDIWSGIKAWQHHRDKVLSSISRMFLNRHLFQIKLGLEPITMDFDLLRQRIATQFNFNHQEDVDFMIRQGVITNAAYTSGDSGISILTKQGEVMDIAEASDLPNIVALGKIVKKHYLTWPKSVTL